MSRLKRNVVSILMVVSMAFVLFGCGSSGDKEGFLGTWESTVDVAELMNEEIQKGIDQYNADMIEFLNIDKCEITFLFTFNDDDTFSISADEDSIQNSIETLKTDFKGKATAYLESVIEKTGYDMSIDDIFALSGTTLDDLINESISDDITDSMIEEMELSGKWEIKDGQLYLTDNEFGEDDCFNYELTSDRITLLDTNGNDWYGILPMLLKKVE